MHKKLEFKITAHYASIERVVQADSLDFLIDVGSTFTSKAAEGTIRTMTVVFMGKNQDRAALVTPSFAERPDGSRAYFDFCGPLVNLPLLFAKVFGCRPNCSMSCSFNFSSHAGKERPSWEKMSESYA